MALSCGRSSEEKLVGSWALSIDALRGHLTCSWVVTFWDVCRIGVSGASRDEPECTDPRWLQEALISKTEIQNGTYNPLLSNLHPPQNSPGFETNRSCAAVSGTFQVSFPLTCAPQIRAPLLSLSTSSKKYKKLPFLA